MTFIAALVFFLWLALVVRNIFSFAYLWYIKEYRFDRLWVYAKTEGLLPFIFPKFRRPPARLKAFFLVFLSFIFLGCMYIVLPLPWFVRMAIVYVVVFPVMSLFVLLLKAPTVFYHGYILYRAKKKLEAHKPMVVVGITGSIGKTTTKEFLATILQSKFSVLKTRESQNAAIGIAEVIVHDLRPEHEIFIVEMGAYKKGEIAAVAHLVRPHVGIVTAINEQHLDLFGTLEHTMQAKYELIEALGRRSMAIFNADNPYTRRMAIDAQKEGREVWMYTREHMKIDIAQKMFAAEHIQASLETISCILESDNHKAKLTIPLSGEQQLGSVLAAVAGAVACGMSFSDAVSAARLIRPFRKTMQMTKGINGSYFIDDTFNNNPDAAKAAIQFLLKAKGKKFLVFQPMIELGSYAATAHEKVGELAGGVCDEIILTNGIYAQSFIKGTGASGFRQSVHIFSPGKTAQFLSSRVKKGDMVLFKGKEAGRVLHLLA